MSLARSPESGDLANNKVEVFHRMKPVSPTSEISALLLFWVDCLDNTKTNLSKIHRQVARVEPRDHRLSISLPCALHHPPHPERRLCRIESVTIDIVEHQVAPAHRDAADRPKNFENSFQ